MPEPLPVAAPGVRVIAINDAYRLAPWADVCYFADASWWKRHKDREAFREFAGVKCSIHNTGAKVEDDSVHLLRNGGVTGLAKEPDTLNTGQNSGFQAVNFAWHAGASLCVLLGYDMKFAGGKTHWHEGHPTPTPEQWYSQHYARNFRTIWECGMRIVNASRDTLLDCFPRRTIGEALA